jgi:hypothetical protein
VHLNKFSFPDFLHRTKFQLLRATANVSRQIKKTYEPGHVEVTRDVEGDGAELLFDVVHQEGLVHDVDGAIGDELLEVVG